MTCHTFKTLRPNQNVHHFADNICKHIFFYLRPANEKRRYKVTPSLIGWAQMGIVLFGYEFH